MIGVGAMIHYLGGGSENAAETYYGRKIVAAKMVHERPRGSLGGSPDESLCLTFSDGTEIAIWDNGQSCCESRYMTTDDDLQSLVGHELRRIEAKEASEADDDGEVHEICFVEIGTDGGFITIANHNQHNGYYGGFGLTITERKPSAPPAF